MLPHIEKFFQDSAKATAVAFANRMRAAGFLIDVRTAQQAVKNFKAGQRKDHSVDLSLLDAGGELTELTFQTASSPSARNTDQRGPVRKATTITVGTLQQGWRVRRKHGCSPCACTFCF